MWVKICGLTNPDDAFCALEAGADALGFIFVRQSPRYLPAHAPDWASWLPRLQSATRVLVVSRPDELPNEWEQCFEVVQWVGAGDIDPLLTSPVNGGGTHFPPRVRGGLGWGQTSPCSEPSTESVGEAGDTTASPLLTSPVNGGGTPSPLTGRVGEGSTLWLALRFPPECATDAILQTLNALHAHAARFVLDAYHPTLLGGTGRTQDWARLREVCARAPRPIMLAGGLTPDNVADAIRTARPAGVDVSSGVEAAPGRKDPAKVRLFIHNAKTALEDEGG